MPLEFPANKTGPVITTCSKSACYNGPETKPQINWPIAVVHIPTGKEAVGYQSRNWFDPVKEEVKINAM